MHLNLAKHRFRPSRHTTPPEASTSRSGGRRGLAISTVALAATVSLLSSGCAAYVGIPGVNCTLTPANSFWRNNVTQVPVHGSSTTWINHLGTGTKLKADFGSGLWQGQKIGIPYTIIPGNQPMVTVHLGYDDSDPGPYPIPPNPNIEGGGDRHILLVDKDNCKLFELWATSKNSDGTWDAGSGAKFDMNSNAMRAAGATSADAAGLPILPGLVRYDEVAAGQVLHAIRMTIPETKNAYVWPASHQAGIAGNYPPMGSWLRLKASVNEANFDPAVRPIIVALKTYGAVIADNGSAFYMSGVPDERWDNDKLATLGNLRGSDFQFINASAEKVANNSYEAVHAQ